MFSPQIERRVEEYQIANNAKAESCLGIGTQGSVFVFHKPSQNKRFAVKFHDRDQAYVRERDVYLRLRDLNIDSVCGHMVPQLLSYEDDFLAIGMTIVSPPFCLDFGGAYLDYLPDYSNEVWADWRAMKADAFEDTRNGASWPARATWIETLSKKRRRTITDGRGPHGPRGLKPSILIMSRPLGPSWPARATWIETLKMYNAKVFNEGRGPHGPRGLKPAKRQYQKTCIDVVARTGHVD